MCKMLTNSEIIPTNQPETEVTLSLEIIKKQNQSPKTNQFGSPKINRKPSKSICTLNVHRCLCWQALGQTSWLLGNQSGETVGKIIAMF